MSTQYPTGGQTTSQSDLSVQSDPSGGRSLGELFSSLTQDVSTLMRQEVALAKAEATRDAKRAGKGAGFLGGAGVAGHFALMFISIAIWWALGNAIGRGWSALIVAVVWAIIASVLAASGRKKLKEVEGMGETADSVKKIPNALKGHEEENR